jgi:aspartyl-tRNA(Asn)/glutamyl-tRNA(Gln) amidotransferase subunit B
MVAEFRAGKEKAFNALVGQAMKATRGKANPQQVSELLRRNSADGQGGRRTGARAGAD